jgi:D-alanine-D-alanine ligase
VLVRAAHEACLAIGLRTGVFNVELILSSRGPRLIDLNARMGGIYLRDWVLRVYGVDLAEAAFALALGIRPSIPPDPAPRTHLVGAQLYASRHGERLRDPALRDRIARLHAEGALVYNAFSAEIPEAEAFEEPFANLASTGSSLPEAKARLLAFWAEADLDTPGEPPLAQRLSAIGLRIAVLVSSYDGSASVLTEADSPWQPERWLDGHHVTHFPIHKATAVAEVEALATQGHDVFLNLCDGAWHDDIAGVEVPETLGRLGVPFTGPDARLHALTKAEMKATALRLGVPTPAHRFVHSPADIEEAGATLRFPLIVKHFDSYASLGMTARSRVETVEDLRREASRMLAEVGGALVEEFVEGDEYTVLVAENPEDPADPWVLAPVACRFPPGETFKHFELKWRSYADLRWTPCADPAVGAALVDATRRIFVGIGGRSYSRCDFRVDAAKNVWFLEINTNCGIFYPPETPGSADVILSYDPGGHRAFLRHILRCALVRAGRPPVV